MFRCCSDTIIRERINLCLLQLWLYAFFWVIPRRLNFICLPAYEDGTDRVFRNVSI